MDWSLLTDALTQILHFITSLVQPHLYAISLAMMATLLVIYGDNVMALLRQQIGSLGFFLKVTVFILFCAFGFGLITQYLTPLMVELFKMLGQTWLGIGVVGVFYLLGSLAQRKGII
ncbi:DUF3392 family protein [Thiomicrospira microaerophila]|uniref:DUF3392 family protein n=1 Tax=Thiomicrospira microaerophila TaxID=406020 RepID=UPI0005CB2385|nr:DUF3392 family protein [Thiomicrospira microaerophila]